MSTNVEPEEAEAINALVEEESSVEKSTAVVQRDFRQPQRFNSKSIGDFQKAITRRLPELEKALRETFKLPISAEVMEVDEVGAEGLFDKLEAPIALAEFEIAGQPAWIRWSIRAAVKAIEHLLGSDGEPEPRKLSNIENYLLQDTFGAVTGVITKALELESTELSMIETPEEIAGWQEAGEEAEEHRLFVAIRIEGLGESSVIHLYLPGVQARSSSAASEKEAAPLPGHLHTVDVELGAHLGCSEIPLNDLLSLELGDVIPLGTLLSEPLQILVEGFECGTAEMGTHNGNRAIRVIEVSPRLDGIA